jgi:hypothetical protein
MSDQVEQLLDEYETMERNRLEAIEQARRAAEQFDEDFRQWADHTARPTLEPIAEQFRARDDFEAEVRTEGHSVRFSFSVRQSEGAAGRRGELAFTPDTGSRSVTVTQVVLNRNTEERRPLSSLPAEVIREQVVLVARNALDT